MTSDDRRNPGRDLDAQQSFWETTLAGELPDSSISPDYPRPPVSAFMRSSESIRLFSDLRSNVRGLCTQVDVTPFVLLLSAFNVLLLRHTGQEDIMVGSLSGDSISLSDNKPRKFINPVVLRTSLAGDPTFLHVMKRVSETVEQAARHRDYPFDSVAEQVQRNHVQRARIFAIMFLVCGMGAGVSTASVTDEDLADVEDIITGCDLVFLVAEKNEALEVVCRYNAELFDSATIVRLLGHFRALLDGIITDPEQCISNLPMMTEAEKEQVLGKWNSTTGDYASDKCIHELFEAQVEQSADAVAAIFEGEQITYGELNARANRLAHYLGNLGVGPETLIGVCMDRSLEMVVGLLGILKAGGAYVPLDPANPTERLAFLLNHAQPPVLLTQERLLPMLPDFKGRVVCLDGDWQENARFHRHDRRTEVTADNLAYVIFTSGSTGMPKGVQITHRNLVNVFTSMLRQPGINRHDRFLAVTTLSFDIATLEILMPLIVGARVVIASGEAAGDPKQLTDALYNSCATIMQATPATWRLLVQAGWSGTRDLRIQCGGESLPPELARQLLERGALLWNLYGPTETTIYSTLYRVTSAERSVPIGRPIANTQVYLLDAELSPVPVGICAQLYIAGDGLARGYFNSPALTAEKFIPNPFGSDPGTRLYATGDLARYLSDGNIEFLGRRDQQVKIRGFRIELGEIEAVLAQHPAVKEAIVLAREDAPGNKRLVAYVVRQEQSAITARGLKIYLKQKLPAYMLPSVLVTLESFPLTSNGKVDRNALPFPSLDSLDVENTFVAPRTDTENRLANIWAEVLGLERVGAHDNFFDLGGHSVLATEVTSRIRDSFRVEVSLRTLFKTPTLARLAESIEEITKGGFESEETPILAAPRERRLVKLPQRR